jgi:hypothetical protein
MHEVGNCLGLGPSRHRQQAFIDSRIVSSPTRYNLRTNPNGYPTRRDVGLSVIPQPKILTYQSSPTLFPNLTL